MTHTSLEGITFVDHTADVGMDVEAPSRERLFHRAAVGMLALLRGEEEPGDGEPGDATVGRGGARGPEHLSVGLAADDGARLLAAWLKELLFLHETRHADYAGATFDKLTDGRLEARIEIEPSVRAVREIKGVTYHELTVAETEDGWKARVIFDV